MTPAQPTKIRLGDTEVTRIGLGTNRLIHTPENVAFIRKAVEAGVDHVDTAHLYTGGESETTIGEALAGSVRGPAVVATKGGFHGGSPKVLRGEIEQSLRRLKTDAIDLYYLHRVDPDTPVEDSLAAIAEYRDAGKIGHVGISEVSVEQIERAREVVPVAAVQNHYNLSDRRHDGVVDYCADERIPFVPYFPLRGTGGPQLTEIAEGHGATPHQIALAWLLDRSPVMLPIPGTLSIAHLRENLAALEIELTEAEREALTPDA
jgi:aryl-alcohol dehydrogenase-like predicted oxidoreductase